MLGNSQSPEEPKYYDHNNVEHCPFETCVMLLCGRDVPYTDPSACPAATEENARFPETAFLVLDRPLTSMSAWMSSDARLNASVAR
ncbi:hypothetical protein LIA77_02107 [Sarocladium implicatum]|jgi:hypothetical protein|nr:hypothetical protein LIA77_02107 [Sarocladium implicatum]